MPPPEQDAPEEEPPVTGRIGEDWTPSEPAAGERGPGGEGGPGTGNDSAGPSGPPGHRARRWLIEGGTIVVIAVAVAVLLRLFVVQVFYVPSTSMLPTLHPGDRIVVDKLSYHLHPIERGDIIVFKRPPGEERDCLGVVPDLVKRVIGLPGERISSRGNTVLINGTPIAQPWLPKGTVLGRPIPPTVVPANSYYVLGDNRPNSCDSRYWGPVPRSLIVGKVVAVVWPLSRVHFF